MQGLSEFGETIFNCTRSLKIYKQIILPKPYKVIKYHAIDKTGLSHCYIYGPTTSEFGDDNSSHSNAPLDIYYNRDIYFGYNIHLERYKRGYECVIKMDSKESEKPINLELLREKYLLLLMSSDSKTESKFYDTSDVYDKEFRLRKRIY